MKPSSSFPFLNIKTDGKHKEYHAQLILHAINALRKSGVKNINASHVKDGGLNHRLPLCYKGHRYDLSFMDKHNEIIMIEIMRTYKVIDGESNEI